MQNKISVAFTFLVVIYIAIIQFYNLGKLPIVQWDESRLAVNAAEMTINRSYLVTTYENLPDLWNTKPPLMIWLQSACMTLFGIHEFSVRFPSAISGFICILFLGFWVQRISKSWFVSSFAMLVLAVSGGFIQLHGSITGDYDALLSLFVLLSVYHFTRLYFDKNPKSIIYFPLFVSLAVMSKSAAGIIMFPLFVLYPLAQKKWKSLYQISLALSLAIIPFIVYCLLRENANSGYIEKMWLNDFGGRFNEVIEGHGHPWYYYLENLVFERMTYFIYLLLPAIIWFVFKKNHSMIFLSFFVVGFLLILSVSKTKIHWYDMPLLPLISLLISVFLYQIIELIRSRLVKGIIAIIVFLMCLPLIVQKFNFISQHQNMSLSFDHYELSEYLRNYNDKEPLRYVSLNYDPEFYFYTKSNPLIKKGIIGQFKEGEKVVLQNVFESDFASEHDYEVIETYKGVKCVRVK
ncbi:MAG: glycosyltransferase family 39 protein [Bacteroidota bacterium]|nr:glycosyltransferase family 39 protein [Bacteroidota bacterium]